MIIQLITLEETPERTEKAVTALRSRDYKAHQFKRMTPGWKGCINSHLEVYRRNPDTKMIFVCEDNISPTGEWLSPDFYNFIEKHDWDLIFVGGYICRPWDYCRKVSQNMFETRNNNHGTVSYIISQRLARKILSMNEIAEIIQPFDVFLSRFTTYIHNPLLFHHAHDIKSNINGWMDPFRKVWFHPLMMKIHTLVFFDRKWLWIIIAILWWIIHRLIKPVHITA